MIYTTCTMIQNYILHNTGGKNKSCPLIRTMVENITFKSLVLIRVVMILSILHFDSEMLWTQSLTKQTFNLRNDKPKFTLCRHF